MIARLRPNHTCFSSLNSNSVVCYTQALASLCYFPLFFSCCRPVASCTGGWSCWWLAQNKLLPPPGPCSLVPNYTCNPAPAAGQEQVPAAATTTASERHCHPVKVCPCSFPGGSLVGPLGNAKASAVTLIFVVSLD